MSEVGLPVLAAMAKPILTGKAQGFAYLALLVVISGSLLMLSAAQPDLFQQAQRQKEQQLLFAGREYREAIRRFYENPNVSVQRFPQTLDELLVDKRSLKPMYHLRRLYPEPISGLAWGLMRDEQGGITGVYSRSNQLLLTTDVDSRYVSIEQTEQALRHSDLRFTYQPALAVNPVSGNLP